MKEYEWKAVFGGKGRIACILDGILFALLLWIGGYLLVKDRAHPILSATLLTAFLLLLGAIPLWRRVRRVRKKLRERLRKELVEKRLLLLPKDLLEETLKTPHIIQRANARLDDVLPLFRDGAEEIWLCGGMETEIKDFIAQNGLSVTLRKREETTERFLSLVTSDEVEEEVERRSRSKRVFRRWKEIVRQWKPNRFTALGALLMALSFTTAYHIYFRLLATASFFLGSILYTRQIMENVLRSKQNERIES